MTDVATSRPALGDRDRPDPSLHQHRAELTGYCYRMLGSAVDAEDAVQETLIRAWRGQQGFEGRAALRSWLYRIATNVCIDMLKGRQRRARPMDLSAPYSAGKPLPPALPDDVWVEPIPDKRLLSSATDPGDAVASQESIRLAFVAALQYLPSRQRAVLILRDVMRWRTSEVAQLLDTTAVSVKSCLQRARETMSARRAEPQGEAGPMTTTQRDLLERYVEAFERYDVDELVRLLRRDATLGMPPLPMWLQGAIEIGGIWRRLGFDCRGSRLVPTLANGGPAFAQYRRNDSSDHLSAFAIHVLTVSDDGISSIDVFIEPDLFELFDLPRNITLPPLPPGPGS